MLFTFLVGWAFNRGKLPSEVWEQYLDNPKDFELLAAYSVWEQEQNKSQEQKAREDAQRRAAQASEQRPTVIRGGGSP